MDTSKIKKTDLKSLGTWKRYKIGQAQVTDWLRKAARKIQQTDIPDGRVHLKHLESLAKIIATGYKPETIPLTPIVILRDVIGLRKKSFEYYIRVAELKDDPSIKAKNEAHRHTIEVLEKVLKILEDATKSAKRTFKDKKKAEDPIANMFELLNMDQTTDNDSEEESEGEIFHRHTPKKTKKAKKPKTTKKAKTGRQKTKVPETENEWIDRAMWIDDSQTDERDDFDYYTLAYCFFEDFNKIRDYVAERWCDYYFDKSVSLTTLAVLHNTACELFFHMDQDLVQELKRNGRYTKDYYFQMLRMFSASALDLDPHEAARWVGFQALVACESLMNMENLNKLGTMQFKERQPAYGASTWHEIERFSRCCTLDLWEEIQMTAIAKFMPPNNGRMIPGEPDLWIELHRFMKTFQGSHRANLVMSLQLHLDMRHILEGEVVHAYEELQRNAPIAWNKLQKHVATFEPDPGGLVEGVIAIMDIHVLDDWIFELKRRTLLHTGFRHNPVEHLYYRIDPVWPGLLDLIIKIALAKAGVDALQRQIPAFHRIMRLYMASQGRNFPEWPLLDKFISSHNVNCSLSLSTQMAFKFAGLGLPEGVEQYWTKVHAAILTLQSVAIRFAGGHTAESHESRSISYAQQMKSEIVNFTLALDEARRRAEQLKSHQRTMQSMLKAPEKPREPLQHADLLFNVEEVVESSSEDLLKVDYITLA